ncbi:MAG TPA: type II toxin-antitoxin system VapC family toxin [Candidatus Competibacteraceae bacterium]|nr:type II toxin-antitoxin system VapC family toxin [Candidatus Competibacteraceae bacterium]
MVIDTSALIAIILAEPEAAKLATCIEQDPRRLISSASLLETSIVTLIRMAA